MTRENFKEATILIVDDDLELRELNKLILSQRYQNITTAEDGVIALELLKKNTYDLLLVDLNMPNISGQQLISKIRDQGGDRMAIVVLTGYGSSDEAFKLLKRLDISDFLYKPTQEFSLEFSIDRALHEQWLRDQVLGQSEILEERVNERTAELKKSLEQLEHTQDQLVQSEKMASLGRLVSGLAQRINIPIENTFQYINKMENLEKQFTVDYEDDNLTENDLEKLLCDIRHTVMETKCNLGEAVRTLRDFKQLAVDQATECCRKFMLKEFIETILSGLEPKKTNVTASVYCSDDLELNSFPGALGQVLTNLVENSILHGFGDMQPGDIWVMVKCTGESVLIEYKDNGCGMDSETLDHIFEPFFSTKKNQGGNGIGLSHSFNLVSKILEGTIECTSTLNQGVLFSIIIPRKTCGK